MSNLVDEIFDRIVFDTEDRAYHFELYAKVKELARDIDSKAPNCAEKTLAFRAMHLALMHVGAALAKQDKYKVNPAAGATTSL